MLEDFGKLEDVKKTLKHTMQLSSYICIHPSVLNLMRQFTSRELLRPVVTRFATSFLTLQSIHRQKANLRKMFTFDKWTTSKNAKEEKGKKVATIIMMPSFWNKVVYILKATSPLVRVLRLVDSEKRPAMGYIYEAMDRAKEAVMKAFNNNAEKFGPICDIIDKRWDCQLHRPLHVAGFFLNPDFSYENQNLDFDSEVMNGFYNVLAKLEPDESVQDKITREIFIYRNAQGLFGTPMAIRQRKTIAPGSQVV
jgi:hypothetical protein